MTAQRFTLHAADGTVAAVLDADSLLSAAIYGVIVVSKGDDVPPTLEVKRLGDDGHVAHDGLIATLETAWPVARMTVLSREVDVLPARLGGGVSCSAATKLFRVEPSAAPSRTVVFLRPDDAVCFECRTLFVLRSMPESSEPQRSRKATDESAEVQVNSSMPASKEPEGERDRVQPDESVTVIDGPFPSLSDQPVRVNESMTAGQMTRSRTPTQISFAGAVVQETPSSDARRFDALLTTRQSSGMQVDDGSAEADVDLHKSGTYEESQDLTYYLQHGHEVTRADNVYAFSQPIANMQMETDIGDAHYAPITSASVPLARIPNHPSMSNGFTPLNHVDTNITPKDIAQFDPQASMPGLEHDSRAIEETCDTIFSRPTHASSAMRSPSKEVSPPYATAQSSSSVASKTNNKDDVDDETEDEDATMHELDSPQRESPLTSDKIAQEMNTPGGETPHVKKRSFFDAADGLKLAPTPFDTPIEPPIKRSVGRPRKRKLAESTDPSPTKRAKAEHTDVEEDEDKPPTKTQRGRGRPRKDKPEPNASEVTSIPTLDLLSSPIKSSAKTPKGASQGTSKRQPKLQAVKESPLDTEGVGSVNRPWKSTRIAFSNSSATQTTMVKKWFAGSGMVQVNDCTPEGHWDVLVVGDGEIKKTSKLLLSLALGKVITTDRWLAKSAQAGRILQPEKYPAAGLDSSVDRTRLFDGRLIVVTPALKKDLGSGWAVFECVAMLAGAQKIGSRRAPHACLLAGADPELPVETLVIALNDTDAEGLAFMAAGAPCYTKDLLTTSLVRGYVDEDSDEFRIAPPPSASSPEPSELEDDAADNVVTAKARRVKVEPKPAAKRGRKPKTYGKRRA